MTPLARIVPLLLALAVGLALAPGPGRAQTASSSRFAFADTTLLRDTLDLDFSDLFRKADSLQLTPDTLRAWMIRYRLGIPRLLTLADSLGMPVDSVGPVLARERFNPLAARNGSRPVNTFQYNSSYNIGQTTTIWTNSSDWNMQRGSIFVTNNTSVEFDRTSRSGFTSTQQRRSSRTEVGWKFSDNFSAGGRAQLDGYSSFDPLGRSNDHDDNGQYQLSVRTRQKPARNLSTEFNLFSGVLDNNKVAQLKRGLNSNMDARVRYVSAWFTQDVSGTVAGNLANTRLPGSVVDQRTNDLSTNVRGTLALFQSAPVGLNVNLQLRRSRVETPTINTVTLVDSINRIVTGNNGIDATLRLRRDDERYMNLTGSWGSTRQSIGSGTTLSGSAALRWPVLGWSMDASWRENTGTTHYPRTVTGTYGYDSEPSGRSAEVNLQRALGRFIARLNGTIGLDRSRYVRTNEGTSLPVDRDGYRQSYRAETVFNRDERLTTTVAMQVGLTSSINIPEAASSSSFDTRSYLGEWRWSYRMLRGLAVTQTNQIQADYRIYTFTPELNDLGLSYNTNTSLQASLTPRLQIEVQHNTRQQPRGSYLPVGTQGLFFQPADESRDYSLRAPVTWSPSPALSLTVTPEYQASDRIGTVNGLATPQRSGRTLLMSGGANLNLPVGRSGHISGNLRRTFRDDRSTSYASGVPQPQPRAETDYWNGQLLFSWSPQ